MNMVRYDIFQYKLRGHPFNKHWAVFEEHKGHGSRLGVFNTRAEAVAFIKKEKRR